MTLTNTKAQQTSTVNQQQSNFNTVSAAHKQLEQKIVADKAAVLQSEKNHDALLAEYLKTAAQTATPVVVDENAVGIQSLVVTEQLAQNKDWAVFKATSSTLGADVCAASTQILDTASGTLSELMVVKIINDDGSFSSPFIFTTHSMIPEQVLKGQIKTDKSKAVLLPLFQSPVMNESAVISRYSDIATLTSALKAHNIATIEFSIPGSNVVVPFSLRGSNAMINDMERCAN